MTPPNLDDFHAPSDLEVAQQRAALRDAAENPRFQDAVKKLARLTFTKRKSGAITLPPGTDPVHERSTAPQLSFGARPSLPHAPPQGGISETHGEPFVDTEPSADPAVAPAPGATPADPGPEASFPAAAPDPLPERMTRADWRILLLIGIPATIVFLLGLGVVVGLLLSGDPRPQPQQPVAVITVTVSAIPEAPPSAPADRSAPTPTASQQTTAAPPDTPSSVPVEPTPSAKPSGSRFKDPAWEIDP